MRKFKLSMWIKPWTLTKEKPTKVLFFEAENNIINEAEKLAFEYPDFRLMELNKFYNTWDFVCSQQGGLL